MTSPYLDSEEAALYLRHVKEGMDAAARRRGMKAFHAFYRKNRDRMPAKRLNSKLYFLRTVLDALFEDEARVDVAAPTLVGGASCHRA